MKLQLTAAFLAVALLTLIATESFGCYKGALGGGG